MKNLNLIANALNIELFTSITTFLHCHTIWIPHLAFAIDILISILRWYIVVEKLLINASWKDRKRNGPCK